ncbi:MAG: ATP-binding cassette domain-containing protein, partial [Arenimonas sp.]
MIKMQQLSKVYRTHLIETHALRGFDISVKEGEFVAVTGPSGSGKSTLVDKLMAHLRKKGKTIGVVAIDPSSPFSGGAVLGDRIRMQDHAGDD